MLARYLPEPRKFFPAIPLAIGGLACLALGILYFFTRTQVHTFDALSYTWAVEDKPLGLLFHPHHLLYGPIGRLAYRTAQMFGFSGRADTPVQVVNAVAGALGIFFLWRFGARWTGRPVASLGVALMVGLSYAYWVYAAEVEVYTLATTFLALALWLLAALAERPRAALAVGLGLAHAGAILFHQTNILFGLALGAFMLMRSELRVRRFLLGYGLGVTVPIVVAYGYVAYASRFADWPAFYDWFTDYARSGQWGGFLRLEHLPALRSGLQNAVSIEPGLSAIFYSTAAVGLLLGVLRARRDANRRAWLMMAGVWLFAYVLFFWWWEPWNIEFWIATLPLWALLILSAWPAVKLNQGSRVEKGGDVRLLLKVAYGFIPFLLALLLFRAHYGPIREMGDATTDYYRQVTEALMTVVQPEELVVTRGNILDLYVPYYGDHPYLLSMRTLEQKKGGDRAQIMGELLGELDYATVTGRPFLIDQFILDEVREPIRNPFGLLPEEIEEIEGRYDLEPLAFRGKQPLFYGTPRYDNVGRTEWQFADSLQGWGTWGVDAPRFEREGWCFTGGVDPQMKGPIINIEAGRWTKLVIDITLEADESFAQIFWRSPEGEYALENSLELTLSRRRRTYEVLLEGMPAWHNTIAQIRIDPIPGNDGDSAPVEACVHAVRFRR